MRLPVPAIVTADAGPWRGRNGTIRAGNRPSRKGLVIDFILGTTTEIQEEERFLLR